MNAVVPLLGLACLALLPACGEPSLSVRSSPRWAVERLRTGAPDEDELRCSRGDVTRPLWGRAQQSDVPINPEKDACVEWELARTDREGPDRAPTDVRLVLVRNGAEHSLPVEALGPESDEPYPWYRFRASLKDAPSGSATLRVLVGEQRVDATGEWWASVPRLYHRRDQGQRPNVLVITVDTLRAEYLGCYGHDAPTSPNIDSLAARSTLFERALSQAAWTLPSYASLFTGRHSESHGVVHRSHKLADGFVSFVELLAAAGYETAGFVSGTFTDIDWGFAQGFDSYDDLGMVTSDRQGIRFTAEDDQQIRESMSSAEKRITSEEISGKAIAWMREHRDRRFFLLLHYFDAHGDFVPHPGLSEKFPPRPIERRLVLTQRPVPQDAAAERALHEGEIAFVDQHIGRVLREVEALDLENDTVVVFCADHGEEFAERYRVGHGHSVFNELVQVPLIVRVPGQGPGRVAVPVANVDVAPTLLELCGVPFAGFGNGMSLTPCIQDPAAAKRPAPAFSAHFPLVPGEGVPAQQRADQDAYRVDQGPWTLITLMQGRQQIPFLFDNENDPLHTVNRASDHPDVIETLTRTYRDEALPALRRQLPAVTLLGLSDDTLQVLGALGYHADEDDAVKDH